MDLVNLSLSEFEYFKLAKRIENFAFRCHFYEASINRVLDLISELNESLSKTSYADQAIGVPCRMYDLGTRIYWTYYIRFRNEIHACHQTPGVEWINPISLSNQPEQKPADGAELLKGLQLSQAAFLVKVMLLDLSEEAALIDEEHERLVSDHHDTERSGIEGFFNLFASLDEDEKKVNMDKVAAAEKAGDTEKANRLREMFLMTPFQIAHDIINEILIPQIDSLLACFSELTQGDTM